MKRFLMSVSAVTLGLFALVLSLLMAIPLTVLALITSKKMQKELKEARFNTGESDVIEGEYEEVSGKQNS